MFSAAAAWDGLAAELSASASSFDSVISDLVGASWAGPAATAMVGIAAGFVAWLGASSGIAEGAAVQARAAAAAFETARTATVHPAEVTANRMQQMALIATNFLGQNTPAIAATDFLYIDMWVQDVVAMLGYLADAASVAVSLTPFAALPADLAGLASQAAVAAQAFPLDAVSQGVQLLSTPVSMALSPLSSLTSGGAPGSAALAGAAEPSEIPAVAAAEAIRPAGGFGASAGLGQARTVGALSVPQSWVGSTPEVRGGSALTGSSLAGAATVANAEAAVGAGAGMPMMPMPTGGGAGGGLPGRMMGGGGSHVVQQRPSVIPRTGV